MADTGRARFESHVDRSGEHHLWLGSRNPQRGTGKLEVDGKQVTAHRRAWELAFGALPAGATVSPCPDEPLCVRVEHLTSSGRSAPAARRAARNKVAGGTRVQVQVNGVRAHRRVRGDRSDVEATRTMLREQLRRAAPQDRDASRWSLADLLNQYLTHLENQGREQRTRTRYESVAKVWVVPAIGSKPARRVTADDIDRCFARMRKAGQSSSSMNQAKALLSGAFKWARRTGKVVHDPMLGFQLPRSKYISQEKLPPEADEVSVILDAAVQHTPDIAALVALAATTGARLSELVALRWSDVDWARSALFVRASADEDGTIKDTKRAQHHREVPVDSETLDLLRRHHEEMSERCAMVEVRLLDTAFLFSVEPDCGRAMLPSYAMKRLQVLKGHLGVEEKRAETIALEDEALRLRRSGVVDRAGRHGPLPPNGFAMSYEDVAAALGRSPTWARRACEAALRREELLNDALKCDVSFTAFRKFTSSELLDAGFNISVVAQRQGHTPVVLAKHYTKARGTARRQAAEHLGRVVHGLGRQGPQGEADELHTDADAD
jgi:integrase